MTCENWTFLSGIQIVCLQMFINIFDYEFYVLDTKKQSVRANNFSLSARKCLPEVTFTKMSVTQLLVKCYDII